MPTRATTTPETLAGLVLHGAEHFGERAAQRVRHDDGWHDTTYGALLFVATEVARGLIALGVRAGDRVAVLADTRAEWTQIQYGIISAGAVTVPIYPTSSPDEVAWVLGDSGANVVVCGDGVQLAKVEQVRESLPDLRHVVVLGPSDGPAITLEELRREGETVDVVEVEGRRDAVRPDDPALIVYTSGTTGRPKGCVLTHRNMTACCRVTEQLRVITGEDVTYLFLPLAHVFAQVVQLSVAAVGGVLAYSSGDVSAILSDCAEVRPTCLPAVPRVFEKVHASVAGRLPAEALEQTMTVAEEVRRRARGAEPVPEDLRHQFEQADAELFSKVRGAFGGRVRVAISGAAPIAPEVLAFFHTAGVPVYEGYALTESASVGTLNSPDAVRLGSVGRPVPGCEVRIAGDGEILMRGPHVFAGYHGDPVATAEMVVDGWLHTGDVGEVDEDGFVTISGRKKDIIITAGGKNIAPANLENDLRQSPWISHAIMYGDRRPYPVALITMDADHVLPWAEERGLPGDLAVLASHPEIVQHVQDAVDAANARYATATQVKRFAILGGDLAVENGLLTPTLKVRRQVVHEVHADRIEALYEPTGSPS